MMNQRHNRIRFVLLATAAAAIGVLAPRTPDRPQTSTEGNRPVVTPQGAACTDTGPAHRVALGDPGRGDHRASGRAPVTSGSDAYTVRRGSRALTQGSLYEVTNPAHDLRVAFTAKGVHVAPGGTDAALRLELAAIGHGGTLGAVSDGDLFASGNRVDYHRTAADGTAFVEWYVNRPDGVEQSFTFETPLASRRDGAPLVLEIDCPGDFAGRLASPKGAVAFTSRDGAHTLRYDGLYAFDADRRELPSWMELDGARLRLVVDDSEATYPVTVDPKVGGGGKTSTNSYQAEVRDDPADAIHADPSDGDNETPDYVDGVDNVAVSLMVIDMDARGKAAPRQARFDFGAARLLPRNNPGHTFAFPAGLLPAEVGADGFLLNNVQFNTWGGKAYVQDATSETGWRSTTDVNIAEMPIGQSAYMAFNVNLIQDQNSAVHWRLWFGPGIVGPVRGLDAQPVKVTRRSETSWDVEAVDYPEIGRTVRAVLVKQSESGTYEPVDFYSMPFRMTFTKR